MNHSLIRWTAFLICLVAVVLILGSTSIEHFKYDLRKNQDYCQSQNYSQEYNDSKECKSFLYRVYDDPIAAFTIVLTIATVGLFIATHRLWSATRRLVAGSEDTARRQLRAYIACDEAFIFRNSEESDTVCQIDIINVGQTSARDIDIIGKLIIYRDEIVFEEIFTKRSPDKGIIRFGLLDPSIKQFFRYISDSGFIDKALGGGGKVKIYIEAGIIYSDVFDFRHHRQVMYEAFTESPVASPFSYKLSMALIKSDETTISCGSK